MKKPAPINLRSFRMTVRSRRASLRRFLTKLEKESPRGLDAKIVHWEKEVWEITDCLTCANCCKTMTPTYTPRDLKRIARHFEMKVVDFKKKWLKQERGGDRDWMNKSTPCSFLNQQDNTCRIYAIRPADCAGFPHLSKKFKDYAHVHKQNVDSCPATFALVERMMESLYK